MRKRVWEKMMNFINSFLPYWKVIGALIFVVVLWIISLKMQREENKRLYLAARNEEISRISEGVAGGIIAVFENQNFIQALNNGVVIKIDINVDGSQNIVIAGKNNQVSR
jgi:hypothetical protein|nr:MAG TPA: hypothetical protein [Caudoviricetes sp.]